MKKIQLLSLLLVFLASCSTSKIANKAEKDMRGDWELVNISADNSGIKIKNIFNHSNIDCFIGSQWHLVANNHKGSYTFTSANCSADQNKISWHMEEENGVPYFWFKQLNGEKAKNVKSGYKLRVVNIGENTAVFSQQLSMEGERITLKYNFVKK